MILPNGSCGPPPPPPICNSFVGSNFNGTAIPNGDTIWFNSHLKVGGAKAGTTISFTGQTIQLGSYGTFKVPDGQVVFSSTATKATTTYSGSEPYAGTWTTTVPVSGADEIFLSSLRLSPSGGLPGGVNPINWGGTFSSTTRPRGLQIQWQWGAAV